MKKLISVLLSLCLLETAAMGQGVVPSVPAAVTAARQNIAQKANSVLAYSNITSFNDAGSPFSVVIIQDLHCHPGVQKNISVILSQLYESYNVKNIFVEGASGELNTRWLSLIEDKNFADRAAEALLAEGKLTGSEYFAYKNNEQNILQGIEDKDVHVQNLRRLAAIVESKNDIESALSDIEKDLRAAQGENYSVFNKKLSRLYGKYKAGKVDSARYYKKLLTYVRISQKKEGVFGGIKVNMEEYSDILEYLEADNRRNSINFKSVSSQISSAINELKNTITYNRYNQIVQKTDSFKNTDVLFEELLSLDKENIIALDKYKDLSKLIKSNNAVKYLNPVKILESERKLLKSLQLAGALTEKEALIVVLSDLFDNYKDYYKAELTSDGYVYLKSFGVKKFQNYFRENVSDKNIGRLDEHYDLFADYYETNIKRDKIFTKFIDEKLPVLKKSGTAEAEKKGYQDILENSEEISVVVCGGFHSSGLEREFKERNISYLVVTPKVEGDYKIAATIYENILLGSVNPLKHAIALQLLSQTGQNAQFKSVIESMLAEELKKNAALDVFNFLNDTVDKICAVDKAEFDLAGVKDYVRPFNKGVNVNDDGTFTITIAFGEKSGAEQININGPASYENSIYGRSFAKNSHLWEWVYLLPFSSFVMGSKVFKSFLGKTFLSGMSAKNVNAAMNYKKPLKIIDAVTSVFFLASFFANPFLLVFSSVIYTVARSFVFTASHSNKFNVRNNGLHITINLITGVIYGIPFALSVFGVGGFITAFAISTGMHYLYNKFFAAIIASSKNSNYSYTAADLISYFYDYERRLLKRDESRGFSYFKKMKFEAMLNLFVMDNDKEMINKVLPVLVRIATVLGERKQAGDMVVNINNAVAAKIKDTNESVSNFISSSETDEYSFWFLQILSHKDDRAMLEKVISDYKLDIKFRLYAYALLRNNRKWDLRDFEKQELLRGAKRLIENFSWKKDLAHLVDSGKWAYNAELQSYITAVYMIMAFEYPDFIGAEKQKMYKRIMKARFDGMYMNADTSLSFGKDLFGNKDLQEVFPEIAAHELAHISLYNYGFYSSRGFLSYLNFLPDALRRNIQRTAVHELFADTAAFMLSLNTNRDPMRLISSFTKGYDFKTFLAFSEYHFAARKQFLGLINLLRVKGLYLDPDSFSKVLKKEALDNIDNKKIRFDEFFYNVTGKYLASKKVLVNKSGHYGYVSTEELSDVFRPLVSDINNSALWEWVYMLPGSSYITRSKFFSGFVANVVMKGKSEEFKKEKIRQLRSNRAVKLLDITGSVIFAVSLLCGGGIMAVSAYMLTRAVIFSYAHKKYTWKENRGYKVKLAGAFLFFSMPFALILTMGGFGIASFALSLAIGIPANFILHSFYNKYKSGFKALRNFPKASILGDFRNAADRRFSYSAIAMPVEDYVKQNGIFSEGYDDRINYRNLEIISFLKEKLGERFNVLSEDVAVEGLDLMSPGDILKMSPVSLYSFDEIDGKYLLRLDNHLLELFKENPEFAEMFSEKLGLDSVKSGKNDESVLHKAAAFEVKRNLLKKQLTIPEHSEVSSIAAKMLESGYGFSGVNVALLQYIAGGININPTSMKHKELIEYQLFETLGYILQSQSWLSPSGANMQYGYLQQGRAEVDRYERQLAGAGSIETFLGNMFRNHYHSHIIKSKEAALYEYIRKKSNIAAFFFIPESLSGEFKHINITGSSGETYSFGKAEELFEILNISSERNFSKYLVIDCRHTDNVEKTAEVIDQYNKSVPEKKRIKEVLFYDADSKDYAASANSYGFKTGFIFDLASFFDDKAVKHIPDLFTRVPAVFSTNEEIVKDYGSRLDNFTIGYLNMLFKGTEALSLKADSRDLVNQLRLLSKPDSRRVKESIHYYEDLVSELGKMNYFDGMRAVAVQFVSAYANECLKILRNNNSSDYDINYAMEEYRTLLNYMLYFKWADIKDSMYGFTQDANAELASAYNSTMRRPVDSSGNKLFQETLLVTSGMSALTTIAALLSCEGVSKISLGKNIYYENIQMFNEMNSIIHKDMFSETVHGDVLRSIRSGAEAVFVDLVANSVFSSESENEDIAAADIKKIVAELSKMKFAKPFYLCIDNSMYPSFQIADIFDGTTLPDNLNIIVYGSMQKMHQRGLEISTAGFLTLISNGFKHKENMDKLKEASALTSSDIDSFRYAVLQEFLQENNDTAERAERLNRNAEEIADVLNEVSLLLGGEFKIIHSSLYTGSQKESWENNNKPGIPFIFIRDTKERKKIGIFLHKLQENLGQENFYDFVQRDSYGFSFLTAISYNSNVLRFNIGDHSALQKDKIIKAMIKTIIYFSGAVSGSEKSIDRIYDALNEYDIKNTDVNDTAAEGILSFLSDAENLRFLNHARILKAFIICARLGKPIPESIISSVVKMTEESLEDDLSNGEKALIVETLKYLPDIKAEKIMEESAAAWLSSVPEVEAAAAANLVDMLLPGKSYTGGSDNYLPDAINSQSVEGLLRAA